ncbi:MAG TPA: UDP-N-acetylglucosamine 2-epimerase (non-hydrolyzing) [Gammaproteobacteria bacterium]|nr:UDP-N-acetylglucosamine 2-epimerase (non-hydrolyzing) [Gammaproteobacteria bacterium]
MKILVVFGTRPEAIKMAPVIKKLSNYSSFNTKICVTAQHRSMLDQVLSLYNIFPHYDLNIMSANQSLTNIIYHVMNGLEDVFVRFKPDWVLVQGDTNTTFAASLAAFYKKIYVGHIEAGLRTHQIYSPWPEEVNRQLTSRIANLHFAPTIAAQRNLVLEGVIEEKIIVTGNTVIDALMETVNYIASDIEITFKMNKQFPFLEDSRKLILVTSHRRENFGEGLQQICHALLNLSLRGDVQIVYPVHLNPNIQEPVSKLLSGRKNIYLLEPQDYLPFVYLMMKSYLILTDSGGIQEEAPSLGKPVLVVRDTTERPEGIKAGTAKLVGTDAFTIINKVEELLDDNELYETMSTAINPYGDGKAAQRIVERLQYECKI